MATWFKAKTLNPDDVKIGVAYRKQQRVNELKEHLQESEAGEIEITGKMAGTTVKTYLAAAAQELWGKRSISSSFTDDSQKVIRWVRVK